MLTTNPPDTLYNVTQIRELDRLAIEHYRIAGFDLMARAAQAAYRVLKMQWPAAQSIMVVCGTGNNGADGYLLASLAREDGCQVTLIEAGDAAGSGSDASRARQQWLDKPDHTLTLAEGIDALNEADVIVDALLGSGLQRDVSGDWLHLIAAINASPVPVLALDIPSGLNADTGTVMGVAIEAHSTVSFIAAKTGQYTGLGPNYVGKLFFDDLDVPAELYTQVKSECLVLNEQRLATCLPARRPVCHKGQFGHVLIVGGDVGMAGAARLAAEAAARAGAGLVSVATRQQHAAMMNMSRAELMSHGVENKDELLPLLDKASVVVIGPGLGQTSWAREMLETILATQLALVVDADALNLIAGQSLKRGRWILTPHVGEAARLLSNSHDHVQQDRYAAVKAISEQYHCVAVLKGAGSLIHTVDESEVYLCRHGNPGMATAGMGDVLSGVIAGLLAQGLSFAEAARMGVLAHALAADNAAKAGQRGMLASDLFEHLRHAMNPQGVAEGGL